MQGNKRQKVYGDNHWVIT